MKPTYSARQCRDGCTCLFLKRIQIWTFQKNKSYPVHQQKTTRHHRTGFAKRKTEWNPDLWIPEIIFVRNNQVLVSNPLESDDNMRQIWIGPTDREAGQVFFNLKFEFFTSLK